MALQQISYQIDNRLYLNITDRCTLHCWFCPKFQRGPQVHNYDLSLHKLPTLEQIIGSIDAPAKYDEVVFCGFGEPTLRLNILLEVAQHVQQRGGRVRLNTDGLASLVHKRDVVPELAQCVDSVSVSLNAQNEEIYNRHCLPALPNSYQAMLDFIASASQQISTVTATAIDGLEQVDINACEEIALSLGAQFRARTLDVVG
ncbi:MAG: TatD family nuclease-associated radical SAM protein [Chromatiales bacterium]